MIENDSSTDADSTSANKHKFAVAIATGKSIRKAAQAVGIAEATGYRWHRDEAVVVEINSIRRAVCAASLAAVVDTAGEAVDRLRELIGSKDEAVALRACQAALNALPQTVSAVHFRQLPRPQKRNESTFGM